MRYFKKMLIPTDGCDHAKAGVIQGMRISKILGTTTIVLVPVDEATFMKDECECKNFEAAENIVKELEDAANSIDLGLTVISKEGNSKQVIEEMIADDEDINIITIGTKGQADAKDVLLGSLHEHLLKIAHVPIIIQPFFGKSYLKKFNAVRDKKVTIGAHFVTLLVALDGSEQAHMAAYEALQFANQLNMGVHVHALHVVKSLKDADGNEKMKAEDHMDIPNKAKDMGMQMGLVVFPEVRIGEDISKEIIRRAAELKADMLIMGTHGKTGPMARFIGNKTEAILKAVPVPVMVVPPELRRSTMDLKIEGLVDDAWDGLAI